MASVKIIREEPKPVIPPIKEVVLTLSEDEAVYLRRLVGHHICGGGPHNGEEASRLRMLNSSIYAALDGAFGQGEYAPLPVARSERTDALFLRSTP